MTCLSKMSNELPYNDEIGHRSKFPASVRDFFKYWPRNSGKTYMHNTLLKLLEKQTFHNVN